MHNGSHEEKDPGAQHRRTFTSMGVGLMRPSLSFSLAFNLASANFLTSRCRRRPKSLNIVEPPERTMFLYSPRRVSMGQSCTTVSTRSEMDVVKSAFENCSGGHTPYVSPEAAPELHAHARTARETSGYPAKRSTSHHSHIQKTITRIHTL